MEREAGNRAVAHFLQGLGNSRLRMTALTASDISRTAEILNQYADSRIDFVDASVMAMAERHQLKTVLTIERRCRRRSSRPRWRYRRTYQRRQAWTRNDIHSG
ncbi:MAG: hypothetical protein AAFO06_24895 [Cyanobacteria bacterium J06597_16]